ncbi:unnamed protein product [Gulo gulo]|uniref:Uncharacterized protein n=1 Tax=Gulo gulo TaxID=48420 RepID=A0A9X9LZU3_GULGU|nr:unnamed protein product [Gulo gulo]
MTKVTSPVKNGSRPFLTRWRRWRTFEQRGAYQKRLAIFQNKKRVLLGETGKNKLESCNITKTLVWASRCPRRPLRVTMLVRNDPLLLMSPPEGRFCLVTKMKMQRTTVIHQDYSHYIRKYSCCERCHKNMSVHQSPTSGPSRLVTLLQRVSVSPCARLCSSTC